MTTAEHLAAQATSSPEAQLPQTGSLENEAAALSGAPDPAWAPSISSSASVTNVNRGSTYRIQGRNFNGLSQAGAYGDDAQSATNYPIVRLTNRASGHVFYARTHDHSTMGVATGAAIVSTNFDVPGGTETGASTLVVVANGIQSQPASITVN